MSNSKSRSSASRKNKQNRRNNRIYRSLLMTFVIAGSNLLSALPLLAQVGTVINNQATGSFTDPANNDQEILIESNTVQVTIAEVAGITVTPLTTEEAPATVANPGPFQDNGKINPEDVVYFTYEITNVGNDPTKFFIPDAPSAVTNGALDGSIEVIEYNPDGNTPTDITPAAVPSGGTDTGNITGLPDNGSIAPGGSITIRVPIKVNAGLADGDVVTAIMGDTPPNDNSAATQNQDFVAGTNDVVTQDNDDGTPGEAAGQPVNGVREASASQDVTVTNANSISGTLYEDAGGEDTGNNTFDAGETKLPADITVTLYNDADNDNVIDPGEEVQVVQTDANGDFVFEDVEDDTYKIKVDLDDAEIPEFYSLGTPNDIEVTVAGESVADRDFGFDRNNPNVVMVKRITRINGETTNPNDGTDLTQFVDDTTSPQADDDNSPNWPANYLVGQFDAGRVRVGDEIEYTIYFLNAGSFRAENLRICDAIQGPQDLKDDAYGTGEVQLNVSNNGNTDLTSDSGDDRAEFIPANGTVPPNCNLQVPNDNGTLVIDVTDATFTEVPGSTAPGTQDSYGLIRFTTVVRDDNP